ncbi:DUF599 domain-containing protein [Azospirillum sp.]|uniref:DUF599 domain-containing protein n=1 Tax=Azospirillum sp. TaxID=34012 RepID=UPI003D709E24
MPSDATPLDLIAFVWLLGAWTAFTLVQDYLLEGRVAVNQHLTLIRSVWMERMLERDNRIMDSQLVGHTMNSCTFFASTTMLVLAGLVGSFGAIERVHEIMGGLSFTVRTSRELLELKVLVLMGIFVFGFFKFTWALRQYNYCCALLGSAPLPPVPEAERKTMARNIAAAMTLAVKAFNGGLRSYYFALAALAWFIHPGVLIAATAFVLVVLIRRQAFSRTERVISAQADALERGVTKQ